VHVGREAGGGMGVWVGRLMDREREQIGYDIFAHIFLYIPRVDVIADILRGILVFNL
jgi:hypothetical protein